MMESFEIIDIVVNGIKVKINILDELEITNISDDMDKIAPKIAFWGAVWASAEQEMAAAEAYYRKWKAESGKTLSAKNDKLAEWKVRQLIESTDEFHQLKSALSKASQNIITARTLYEAFKTKASMLQSKGAMMRAEIDSTSMHTSKASNKRLRYEKERLTNKEQLKNIFKSKKTKSVK